MKIGFAHKDRSDKVQIGHSQLSWRRRSREKAARFGNNFAPQKESSQEIQREFQMPPLHQTNVS